MDETFSAISTPEINWSLTDNEINKNSKILKGYYDNTYIGFKTVVYTHTLILQYKNQSGDFDIEFNINKKDKCFTFKGLFKIIEFITREQILSSNDLPDNCFSTLKEAMEFCLLYFHSKYF